MKSLTKILAGTFLAALISSGVQANLIQNGSFEDIGSSVSLGYGSASTWQIYSSIPDWDASQNIEIWSNNFIVPAYHGNRVLELNAHPGRSNGVFSIFQSFSTNVGQTYELTFAGHRRYADSNEAFNVSVGNLLESISNQLAGQWNEYKYQFTALSSISELRFTSRDGGRDTTGNILDDIRVTAIPEPASFALLMLGLVGLVYARKKVK